MNEPDLKVGARQLLKWQASPLAMVRELFGVEPDPWQAEALEAFPTNPRLALSASKGPGKTAVLAWLCWNFLLTRPFPKVVATSISADNLRDNLWAEMAKWRDQAPLLQGMFEWNIERIVNKDNPETWWMSARAWSRSADASQQANTLAGLHADYVMAILDESGGIPDAVMSAAEGIGSSAKEWHIVQAGNTTHLSGPLYRACTSEASLWKVIRINGDPDDPKRSPRISVQWARDQIAKYGKDNPWVLVNVYGRFPPASINSLLGPDDVRAAINRELPKKNTAPVVLGVDVARYGDDSSIIYPRQGFDARSRPPQQLRNVNGIQGAGHVIQAEDRYKSVATFIDMTGGFGAAWFDQLEALERMPIPVVYSGESSNPRYYNKRTEIHFALAEWVKLGGCLPDDPEIIEELTAMTYTFKGNKLLLEDKDLIKEKIGRSPDKSDALAETFAEPVTGLGVVGAGWKDWKGKELPELRSVVVSAYSQLEEGGGKWCATAWGIFQPADSKVPAAILLEVERGDSPIPEYAKKVKALYKRQNADFVLTWKSPRAKATTKHLWSTGLVTRNVQYDPTIGPHGAGEVIAAGRAWVPERKWAAKLLQDFRRYPAEGTEVTMHSAALALTWLRWYEGVEPDEPPPDEELEQEEIEHERRKSAGRSRPIYG